MKNRILWAGARWVRATVVLGCATVGVAVAASAEVAGVAVVNRLGELSGRVEGSIRQNAANGVTLNRGAVLDGDLFVVGRPTVMVNGTPVYAGTIDGVGAPDPSGYSIWLNSGASLGHVVRRSDAVTLGAAPEPTSPSGTRAVEIGKAGQSVGSWATLRDLRLNGAVGTYAVPPGAYGDFSAGSGGGFVLGVAGGAERRVYSFRRLVLNGNASLRVVGPVEIRVGGAVFSNGPIGSLDHPEWLDLRLRNGGFTLNSPAWLAGYVCAPAGEVAINANTQLVGGLECDSLRVNGGGVLRLRPKNQPPVAEAQTVETDEDVTVRFTLAANDPEGQPLVFTLLSQPTLGVLSGTAPNLTFTPEADRSGTTSFTFKVSDGQLESGVATVTIKIRPVNDCPVSVVVPVRTAEDTAVPIALSGYDVEGDTLSYAITRQPEHGALSGTAPAFTYMPLADYSGSDALAYTVSDGACATAEIVVSITVDPANDAPVAHALIVATCEDTPEDLVLGGTDVDGDPLTYRIVTGPAHGTLTGNAPSLTYRPDADWSGTDSFTYVANDGTVDSAAATVTIEVRPLNDCPESAAAPVNTREDTAVAVALVAIDRDSTVLTFAIVDGPAHGALGGVAPDFIYTPAANYNGPDRFTYTVSDGLCTTAAIAVPITIDPVNDAPTAQPLDLFTDEDRSLEITPVGTDVDGSALTFAPVLAPTHGTLVRTATGWTYTPAANYHGDDFFTYQANDGALTSVPARVLVAVRPVNDAPQATDLSLVTDEDTAVAAVCSGTDVDGDALTYRVVAGPAHGTLAGTAPSLSYQPNTDWNGTDSFTYVVNDGTVDSAAAKVTIEVRPLNDCPVSVAEPVRTAEDTAVPVVLAAADRDGDVVAFALTAPARHGVLSGVAPALTYTPELNYNGSDSFAFTVSDGRCTSAEVVVPITVIPVNDAPVAADCVAETTSGRPVTITPVFSDPDTGDVPPDVLVITAHVAAEEGAVVVQGSTLVFTPAAAFRGTATVRYTVTDSAGAESTARCSVVVAAKDEPPPPIDAGGERWIAVSAQGRSHTGTIVVNNDEWTLSDWGFSSAPTVANFARNLGDWFKQGDTGEFLVYSSDFGLVGGTLKKVMTDAGHRWDIVRSPQPSLAELSRYDAVFLCGSPLDPEVLQEYLEQGGCVYICGCGYASDQALWNPFLAHYGIRLGGVNPVDAAVPVSSSHPLLQGVESLLYRGGNHLTLLPEGGRTNCEVIHRTGTYNLIAAFTTGRFRVRLEGAFPNPPPEFDPASVSYRWEFIEGPGAVQFANGNALVTDAYFSKEGTYRLRLTASNGFGSSNADVLLHLEFNGPPLVSAGADQLVPSVDREIQLQGSVEDDNRPEGGPVTSRWTVVSAPQGASVVFADPGSARTGARCDRRGWYLLRLEASDTVDSSSDTIAVGVGVRPITTPKDLCAWWPLDHHPREVINGNHDAVWTERAAYAPGQVFAGVALGGAADFGQVARHGDLDVGTSEAGMTMELWVRSDDTARDTGLIQWSSVAGSGVFLRANRESIYAEFYDTAGARHYLFADGVLKIGQWTHVAATYDRRTGEGRIYANGTLVKQAPLGVFTPQTTYDLYFGVRDRTATYFKGALDEIALYRRPLLPSEIQQIFRVGGDGRSIPGANAVPRVDAGLPAFLGSIAEKAVLSGVVTDDGQLLAAPLVTWSMVSGPGTVTFDNSGAAATGASFSEPGAYVLSLSAYDGQNTATDLVEVRVDVSTVPAAGVAAWWPLNEHPHEVVNGNHDVEWASPNVYVPGQVLSGVACDGVYTFGQVAGHADLNVGASEAGMAMELWVRSDDTTGDTGLIQWSSAAGSGVFLRANRESIYAEFYDTAGARHYFYADGVLKTGQWTHVAATYDRKTGEGRIYANGTLVKQSSLGVFTPQTTYDLYLGVRDRTATYFKGVLDEIALYRRPLLAGEIKAIYDAGPGGRAPILNQSPAVAASSASSVHVGVALPLTASALDDGLPNPPATLTYAWSKVSGPGTVTFAAANMLSTTATFDAVGTYTLRFTASDSVKSASADVTVSVVPPPSAPPTGEFVAPLQGGNIAADTRLMLIVKAVDSDGAIARVEFFLDGVSLGFGGRIVGQTDQYGLVISGGVPVGTHVFAASVTDNTNLTVAVPPVTVAAAVPPSEPPVVSLTTPVAGATITAPTAITGVAYSTGLASWAVEGRLRPAAGASATWRVVASGGTSVGVPASATAPETPGQLGTFDPTNLLNGIHELRLRATDIAGRVVTTAPISVVVDGGMKLGHFSVAFKDLELSAGGLPIEAVRSYDSRDTREGDFGPGWGLAINGIRLQKNGDLSPDWEQVGDLAGMGTVYHIDPLRAHTITVTLPDGETHRFEAGVYVPRSGGPVLPDNYQWLLPIDEGRLRFYPVGETTGSLVVDGDDSLVFSGMDGEEYLTQDAAGAGDPFNPTRFRFTTKEGTVFVIDEKLGVLEMHDLVGNTLTFVRDGMSRIVTMTSTQFRPDAAGGPITRSVTVHRDSTGRVASLEDLAGRELNYLYDEKGRLASFIDREENVTEFFYENPKFPHYLTRIVDPLGRNALRCEFDDSGRMTKQIDADGKETLFARGVDVTGSYQRVKDRLGHETTYYYDTRGNVTLKIDPEGAQTTYAYYPGTDRAKFETDHYGNTKSFAYDAKGNVTVETIGASLADDPSNPESGYVTRTTYGSRSEPTSMVDSDGRQQSFAYDAASGQLLTHTTGLLDSAHLSLHTAGLSPAPAQTTYTYTASGEIESVTDALGNVTFYTYDESFTAPDYPTVTKRVTTTVTDPAGAAGSDSANAADTILRTNYVLHGAQGNRLAEIAPRTLPDGSTESVVTRYLYDAEDRLVATVQPDGMVSETRYDAIGKEAKALRWKSEADYLASFGVAGVRDDAAARVTAMEYDSRGNLVRTTFPDASTEEQGYDAENRRVWSQDRLGRRTFFVYDKVGRLLVTILPDDNDGVGAAAPIDAADSHLADNPRSETVYDKVGRVLFQIDVSGAMTEYTYEDGCGCAMRRKEMIQHRVSPNANLVTTYQYDNAGNVRYVTDPRRNTVETRYDAHGRQTEVVYPATDEHPATTTETRYDALGRRIAVVDQEGKVTRYRYDGLGRLIEVRQYLDQSVAASDAAFQVAPSDPRVVSTRYSFDELGNQTSQTDALGRVTRYETDASGRRLKRHLPKNLGEATAPAETLDYDAWGHLWHRIDFAGKTTTFEYDTMGRLKRKLADATHPSLVYSHAVARIEFDYDAGGARIAARTYGAGGTLLYRESTPRLASGAVDYKETASGTLDYDYFASGQLKDVVSSSPDGVNVGYRYDELNRLEYVDDASAGGPTRTSSYTYNANGSLEAVTYANRVAHIYGYDSLNRLRTLQVGRSVLGEPLLHGYTYALRPSGHRRQVVEASVIAATRTTTYDYDSLYRLTGETVAGGGDSGSLGSVSYTLDKVGNRLNRTTAGGLQPQLPTSTSGFDARDRLTESDGRSFGYDANGNTTSGSLRDMVPSATGTFTDISDFENRLILRTKSDGTQINISYDADGNRVQKAIFDDALQLVSATYYLVDTNNLTGYSQVLEERTTTYGGPISVSAAKVYTYGSDLISVGRTVPGEPLSVRYFGYDGHGSVRELTDAGGAVAEAYTYDAFGVLTAVSVVNATTGQLDQMSPATWLAAGASTSTSLFNSYLYCGEQWDFDLGLYFNRARYLNVATGRFWSMDTYEGVPSDPASIHKYLYANANPLSFSDPSGNTPILSLLGGSVLSNLIDRMATVRSVRAFRRVTGMLCKVGKTLVMPYNQMIKTLGRILPFERHHIFKHESMVDLLLNGYTKGLGFAIPLLGGNSMPGTPHFNATAYQRRVAKLNWPASRVAYGALLAAGCSVPDAREIVQAGQNYNKLMGWVVP